MKLCLAILLAYFSVQMTLCHAESTVYVVEKDGRSVIVAGTIHLLNPREFPLPAEFIAAYNLADEVVFETDLSRNGFSQAATQFADQFRLPAGQQTQDFLTDETWLALLAMGRKKGLPVKSFANFHPAFHVQSLVMLETQKLGYQEGVDVYFYKRAIADGKLTSALESVAFQMDQIGNIKDEDPNKLVESALEEIEVLSEVLEKLVSAWRSGDTAQLAELVVDPFKLESPDLFESLFIQRNRNWLPMVESYLAAPRQELILVGAGHLVGEGNLLELLQQAGYCVYPYQLNH